MLFGVLYFCVVILYVNRSRSSFILYRIVKHHSRQSNVRRIWTCTDNAVSGFHCQTIRYGVNSYSSQSVLKTIRTHSGQFVLSFRSIRTH